MLFVWLLAQAAVAVQHFEVQYVEEPSSNAGFFDPEVGALRRLAFNYAVGIWGQTLEGTIPIRIKATFTDFGNTTTLGQGSTARRVQGVTGGLPNTVYPSSLASQLNGVSMPAETGEYAGFHLWVQFNTQITNFYYGLDGNPANSQFDFVSIALHEIGHGLGFYDATDPLTGDLTAFIDVFTRFYVADFFGLFIFEPFTSLSNSQRAVLIASGDVYFNSPRVRAFATLRGGQGVSLEGFSEIHTGGVPPPPSTDPPPSVLSHWHSKHAPNMTMEPAISEGESYLESFFGSYPVHKPGDLVIPAFYDIGYQFLSPVFPYKPVWPPTSPSGSPTIQNIPLSNMRVTSINLTAASISGLHASDFSIVSGGAPAVIAGNSFHNLQVSFAPSAVGLKMANLLITMSGGQVPVATIPLSGIGRGTDSDGDRISDLDETRDLDPSTPGTQNPFNPSVADSTANNFVTASDSLIDGWNDWDNDGMNNEDEFTFGYNPINPASFGTPTPTDTDGDGISDALESFDLDPNTPGIQNPFNPVLGDTSGNNGSTVPDGIPDGQNDFDGDGLSNLAEVAFGINPFLFDTDGDGFGDGAEAVAQTNIFDPNSRPPTGLMWVDFGATGIEAGIESHPFNTLAEVLGLLDLGGTINIKGDSTVVDSTETPTISTPMTIQSVNGSVRIGIAP